MESPVAPEEVASAASVNTTGPSIARLGNGAVQGDELALHAVAVRPELLSEPDRLPAGERFVAVGDDENLAAQFRYVGERIADHDPRCQRGLLALQALAFADEVAVTAGFGNKLVAPHQRRDDYPRQHRPDGSIEELEEEARGPRARVGEVDVRIGVVDREAVDLA